MYWLDIQNGPSRGRRCVQRRVYTLGSDLSCQLWIRDASIAPRQLDLEERDAGVMIRVRDPADAVKLNGRPVDGEALLSDGDTLAVGSLRIRYRARISLFVRAIPHVVRLGLAAGLVAAVGFGFWRYLRHQAGLDRIETAFASPPVVIPPPAPVVESKELRAMERIGDEMRREVPFPPPPPPSGSALDPSPPARPPEPPPPAPVPDPAPELVLRGTKSTIPAEVSPAPGDRSAPVPESTARVEPPAEPLAAMPAPAPESVVEGGSTPDPVPQETVMMEPQRAPLVPPPEVSPPTPPKPADDPMDIALAQTRALMEAGQLDTAADRVAEFARQRPDHPPVIALQARLAERQGRIQDAERFWTRILKEAMGDPLYDEAFAELVRLANVRVQTAPPSVIHPAVAAARVPAEPAGRTTKAPAPKRQDDSPPTRVPAAEGAPAVASVPAAPVAPQPLVVREPVPPQVVQPAPVVPAPVPIVQPATARPSPAPRPAPSRETERAVSQPKPRPPPAPVPPVVASRTVRPPPAPPPRPPSMRIRETSITRFPASRDYDDFRMLQVDVELVDAETPINPDRVLVEVVFFDRYERSGEIVPSRVSGSVKRVGLDGGDWREGEMKSVTVPYQIPANTRASSDSGPGGAGSYFGHRVRVLVDGRPVHEMAKPSNLP